MFPNRLTHHGLTEGQSDFAMLRDSCLQILQRPLIFENMQLGCFIFASGLLGYLVMPINIFGLFSFSFCLFCQAPYYYCTHMCFTFSCQFLYSAGRRSRFVVKTAFATINCFDFKSMPFQQTFNNFLFVKPLLLQRDNAVLKTFKRRFPITFIGVYTWSISSLGL